MEIKFELDTDKAARSTVAIAASYGLGRQFEGFYSLDDSVVGSFPHLHHL
jgi:hypothetical protein